LAVALALLREKTTDEQGNLREMVIWRVAPNPRQPEGIRYRLALIRARQKFPAVLYDNNHPKGHHRHIEGVEEAYEFANVEGRIADFMADLSRAPGAQE